MNVQLNTPVNGKVKSVTGSGTYKDFFTFEYTFEDGVVMKANHKENAPRFNVGDDVEYTVKFSNQHGNLGSIDKPQDQQGGGSNTATRTGSPQSDPTQKSIETQKCLDIANQYHIAHGFQTVETHKEVCDTARLFYAELFENK